MLTIDELSSTFNEFLPLVTVGATLSAVGLIPRIGPGRALWIALRSRFAFKPKYQCVRHSEIKLLKKELAEKSYFDQGYFVIRGEMGVGKSCLLESVTSKTAGVIHIDANPGDIYDEIIQKALTKLTNHLFELRYPFECANRIIFWHRIFTFGHSPIIVIHVPEVGSNDKQACLSNAVRTLTESYKLRVVVEGTPNSLEEPLFHTYRERVFEIKPMTKEMIWEMSQLKDLFKHIKAAGLDDIVFAVLGGNPSNYEKLWEYAKLDMADGMDSREAIGTHLCAEIYDAIKIINSQDVREIIELFDKDKNYIPTQLLEAKKLKRPTHDRVFCEEMQDRESVLIPASNAIGIVLRHSLKREPSFIELESMLKTKL